MSKEYIISTGKGKMYRSFFRIPIPFYCFGTSDISVQSAVKYSDARKFHTLWWATHRARYLSKHSGSYYYVYTIERRIDDVYLMRVVDDTIHNKQIENEERCSREIDTIINNWRAEHGITSKRKEV